MGEIIRLLKKILRPLGYDVRRFGAYALLPFPGETDYPEAVTARRQFEAGAVGPGEGRLDRLRIVVRTCIRLDRNPKNPHGVAGGPLDELVEHCLGSVVRSVNAALAEAEHPEIEVTILDDHSEPEYVELIRRVASPLACPWRIVTTAVKGQGPSLHEQFTNARTEDALYYFCEDDYLHEESAIIEMWRFYRQIYAETRRHLVLHPQNESTYRGSLYPSYLVLSPTRYWRTTAHMTHVLFTHAFVLRDHWDCFENAKFIGDKRHYRRGSESRTTNRLFTRLMGFTPIPPLAGHLQNEDTLPPLFDWRKLW